MAGLHPYHILIASDSFKGSLTSVEANELIAQGVRQACHNVYISCVAVADGGEGTVDAFMRQCKGDLRELSVEGSFGNPVKAKYGLLSNGAAVIEAAAAAGIGLSGRTEDDALRASTYGVGQLISDALDHGATTIYVGLGGSATSDGGAGAFEALGGRLYAGDGRPVARGLVGLKDVKSLDSSQLDPRLRQARIVALADVLNPLCGPKGAIYTFGPQKGLQAAHLDTFESWMVRWAFVTQQNSKHDVSGVLGAGAAGGLGFGLAAFCHAHVEHGIEVLLRAIGFDRMLTGVDLVITGEGKIDKQTALGKTPVGIAQHACAKGIPVVAVVGSRSEDLGDVWEQGIGLVVPAVIVPATLQECISRIGMTLPIAGESAMRAFLLGQRA